MGGGHSSPVSNEHNGVNIVTCSGAYSVNTYSNITSGGGNTYQTASATGAKVGVKASYSGPIPALMNLGACPQAQSTTTTVY